VVKKIADEHGSRIDIANRVVDGKVLGAQVSLSFAVDMTDSQTGASLDSPVGPTRRRDSIKIMANILVVDDELGIRDLLQEILNDEGHNVEVAENAAQARAARLRDRPDLVSCSTSGCRTPMASPCSRSGPPPAC
jgi:PleD family two-component response regulator